MHVWLSSCMVSPRVGLHWCMGYFCTQTESRVFCSVGRAGPHLFGWLGLLFIVCRLLLCFVFKQDAASFVLESRIVNSV